MHATFKFLLACSILMLLGACAGLRTGNSAADAAVYTVLGAAEAKSEQQKKKQQAFEQDLANATAKPR